MKKHYVDPERDYGLTDAILYELQDCHVLDTGTLYALVQDKGRYSDTPLDYTAFQRKLTKLITTPDRAGRMYLHLPDILIPWDRSKGLSRPRPIQNIIDLAEGGYSRLSDQGKRYQFMLPDTGPIIHRYMLGFVLAQFKLGCRARGFEYISFEDIARDKRCKDPTMTLTTSDGELKPDGVCGIRYPDGRARFFAIETERYSKDISATALSRAAFGKKVPRYQEVLRKQLYRKWGIPNLVPLVIADSFHRMTLMNEAANDNDFLFHWRERFGKLWHTCPMEYEKTRGGNAKPVRPIIEDPFADPCYRKAGRFDISRP